MRFTLIRAAMMAGLRLPQVACAFSSETKALTLADIELGNPVVSFGYAPGKMRYETMPERIRRQCKDFTDPFNWVFAHVGKYGADYYIVMSWRPDQDSDSLGAAVRLFGDTCQVSDLGNMFTGFVPPEGYAMGIASTPPDLPGVDAAWIRNENESQGNYHYLFRSAAEEAVFRALIRDAAAREEGLWGREKFRSMVCPYSDPEAEKLAPVYVQERLAYCSGGSEPARPD